MLYIVINNKINNKIKIPFVYFSIGALVILILNEIYNNAIYSMKDFFFTTQTVNDDDSDWINYRYDKEFNPYDYYSEYKHLKIPFYNAEEGLRCIPQTKILQNEIMNQKLDLQDAYFNNLLPILERKPVTQDEGSDDIYNPIPKDMFVNKKCPTVCHVITDKRQCRNERKVPEFGDKNEFDSWINIVNKCSNLDIATDCNNDDDCEYDTDSEKCYSIHNLRKCIPFPKEETDKKIVKNLDSRYNGQEVTVKEKDTGNQKSRIEFNNGDTMIVSNSHLIDETECHTKCEYLNIHGNKPVSEINCNSAIFSNGDRYCQWDDANEKCKPSCDRLPSFSECEDPNGDRACFWDTTAEKCKDRCSTITEINICSLNNSCKYNSLDNICENK
jgi:hypothetical protein